MGEITYQLAKDPTPSGELIGVDLAPQDPARPFWVWSGVGYHTHAARISAAELVAAWPEHFALVASWLEPLLRVHEPDAPELPGAVLAAFERYHGKQAPLGSSAGA
ncbi:hypothetical protein [Lysobacter claricitrinus]|uniref:hypothetical protein n=1 Tax=Lysobacter claricitrinus TaxID=3367728 RepID=UPI0037DACA12